MKIVCFGDSNTYGYDPRSWFGDRYPETVRWTGLLKQQGFDVCNEGENGRQIPSGEWMIEHACGRILRHAPFDLLCVMLGSNDLLMGSRTGAEEVSLRMEAFLNAVLSRGADGEFLLISPPVMHLGDWVSEERLLTESARMRDHYLALSEKLGIRFADAEEWGVETGFDGVHFTEAGHEAFARGLSQELRRIV